MMLFRPPRRKQTRKKDTSQGRAVNSTSTNASGGVQNSAARFKRKKPGPRADETQKDVLWTPIGKGLNAAVGIYMDLRPARLT